MDENVENDDNIMITSIDNPWNPFTQFDEWYAFDMRQGYNICGLMASFTTYSRSLPETINEADIDEAIDQLCNDVFKGLFIKVSPESYKDDGTIVPVP